jgi:hypothetical protein
MSTYLVWDEHDTRDDARRFTANNASEAVCAWAEDYDLDENRIASGSNEYVFCALDEGGSEELFFQASGYAVAHYSAEEVE